MDKFYLVKSFEIPKYTSVLEKSIVLDKMLFRMEVKMSDQTSLLWVMVHIYIWSVSKKKKLHYLLEGELNSPTNTSKWKERERNNKLILNVNFFFTLLSNFIIIARDLDQFSREYYHKFLLYLFFWHHFDSNFIHFYQGLEGFFSLLFILKTFVTKYFNCEFLVRIK